MAGRTSTSFGMGVAVTLLSLSTLGFFVAFAIYFGKCSDRTKALEQARQDQLDVINQAERKRDDISNLIADAKKNKQSLVAYLIDSQANSMQLATGSRRDQAADLAKKMKDEKIENGTLLAAYKDRGSEVDNLKNQLSLSDGALQKAKADLAAEVARVAGIEKSHQDTVNALTAEVNTYKSEVETYRKGTDDYKKQIDAQSERRLSEAGEKLKAAQDQLAKTSEEKLILEGQLAALRKSSSNQIYRGDNEEALVDASVIAVSGSDRQAFISIGNRQHVVLGMTFAVYSDKTQIHPDADGNYPRGKATLEVTNVGDTSSTCRITSEVRGNPVVKGDVVANAVYDPSKSYKFVVFGNFDTNRDGAATALERADISAMVRSWGGQIADDLTGDVDFLVLGERPVVPPRPSSDAPLQVVEEYIRRQREVERYDDLNRRATATSIPILTENRLYTLIGRPTSRASR